MTDAGAEFTGKALANIRLARGHMAKTVAAELGLVKETYSRWEHSTFLPRRVAFAMLYAMDRIEQRAGNERHI